MSKQPQPPPQAKELRTVEILRQLVVLAAPLSIAQLAQYSIVASCLVFAGRMGVDQLGGVSMAMSLLNATGYCIGAGCSGALETLLTHTFGRNPRSVLYGVHAQRMVLLLLIVAVPLGAVLAFINNILLFVGQTVRVVQHTTAFARVALFGLVPMMLLEVQRRYFAGQQMARPFTAAVAVAALACPALLFLFADVLQLGVEGIGAAWVTVMTGMNVGLVAYLRFSGTYGATWGGWNRDALCNWGPMLRLAVASLGITVSEWGILEINTLSAGLTPPQDLAAFVIGVQVMICLWNIAAGIYIGISVLVGNNIGAGLPLVSRRFAHCAIALTLCIALVDTCVVLACGRRLAYVFTDDEAAVDVFESLIPYVVVFHILDTAQSNILGILRGCGKQRIGAIIITLGWALFGIPLGWLLCFRFGVGVRALFLGPILGIALVAMPMYVTVLWRMRWESLKAHGHDDNDVPPETLAEEDNATPMRHSRL